MENSKNIIYSIDLDGPITPLMARDALVECFSQAHCADAGLTAENDEVNRAYCRDIVKKSFTESDGNFDNPSKQAILNAMGKLQDFAKKFRDPSIIQKHAVEMMKIVEKIN